MTRVTILAGAAAAIILLGIAALGTPERRSENHAGAGNQTVAPKGPIQR